VNPWIALSIAYAAGCVSFASIVGRCRGVDVRALGSGNPGATNVGRVLGPRWGALVLLLDLAKGALPVWLLSAPMDGLPAALIDPEGGVLLLAAATLGHVYPISARFAGGKGVATMLGGCLALEPFSALGAVLLHLLMKRALGFVSVASLILVWAVPALRLLVAAAGGAPADGVAVLALLAAVVTVRHRGNLARVRAGIEDRYDDDSPHLEPDRKP